LKKNVILAAGGTGGHIYPALAVAEELLALDKYLQVNFWGATEGMENKIIPDHGYKMYKAKMGRLNHNVATTERIFTLFLLPIAILKAISVIIKLKPNFIMGFGGHASAPMIIAGKLLGKRIYLWEPNAFPGLANRKLSLFVKEAFVVFEKSKEHMKCPVKDFGMPIRKDVELSSAISNKNSSTFNVLIYGGSQGSVAINNIVIDAVLSGLLPSDIRIKLQTGVNNFDDVSKRLANVENVEVVNYIDNMPDCYKWADLTIARAGTGTLSELAAVAMPSILIPLPSAADNHQFHNAKALADQQACILLEQKLAENNEIINVIVELKNNQQRLDSLSENIKGFYQKGSANKIAEYLLNQIM